MKIHRLCLTIILILIYQCSYVSLIEDVSTDSPTIHYSEDNNENADNVSGIVRDSEIVSDLEPSVEVPTNVEEDIEKDVDVHKKQLFAEATSQNSGVANDMTNNGSPVVVTLVDVATAELQQRAILSSQKEIEESSSHPSDNAVNGETNRTEPLAAVPATKTNQTTTTQKQSTETEKTTTTTTTTSKDEVIAATKDNTTKVEEIPSFSEWAQKRLEEAEKQKEPQNTSSQQHNQTPNGKQSSSGAKLRWKNYASPDCGAKVVASNPEAISPSAILSPSRDEYKLNTCTSRIWFIVELCEAIQAKKIDFANFELFSSSPKDFSVSIGDRFPSREWTNVGQFTAKDERDIQSFDLSPQLFGKYIKVEVKSHYGSEHYCPISLFRVYGTSEFEVLQKEDVHPDRLEDDDEDDDDESLDIDNGDSSKNLFSSATDAVISVVKKAAEILGNKKNHTDSNNETLRVNNLNNSMLINSCCSPSHLVVCDNCSDGLFEKIYEMLSCHSSEIRNLVSIPFIKNALINSNICQEYGFEFNKNQMSTINSQYDCVKSFFPARFLGAMCNFIAVTEKKVVFNTSSQYLNDTKEKSGDDIINIETSEPKILVTDDVISETVILETSETGSKFTCSTDINYSSQIKPTKTITSELVVDELNTDRSDLNQITSTESTTLPESMETVVEPPTSINKNDNNKTLQEDNHETSDNEPVTESTENLDDHLEHFISELNGETPGQNVPTTQQTPQGQKESVFLRLVNRIKALERNMSLSSQYLEELSKRYKKQVDEMQKMLDKTILTMTEEMKKKEEYNKHLEETLAALTKAVDTLVAERNNWSCTFSFLIISTIIILTVYSFYRKRRLANQNLHSERNKISVKRRKSIDVVSHNLPQKKKRRPSDQALKIVRSAMVEEVNPRDRRKKKKKHQQLKRSVSITTLTERSEPFTKTNLESHPQISNKNEVDWVEGEAKKIEEIPFVLEESEHSTLEPLPDSIKIKAPSFIKTAENVRMLRVNGNVHKKSASVDESIRLDEINGSIELNGNTTPKKEKKSLKKIFRKVF